MRRVTRTRFVTIFFRALKEDPALLPAAALLPANSPGDPLRLTHTVLSRYHRSVEPEHPVGGVEAVASDQIHMVHGLEELEALKLPQVGFDSELRRVALFRSGGRVWGCGRRLRVGWGSRSGRRDGRHLFVAWRRRSAQMCNKRVRVREYRWVLWGDELSAFRFVLV